jgi:hypothetical protein
MLSVECDTKGNIKLWIDGAEGETAASCHHAAGEGRRDGFRAALSFWNNPAPVQFEVSIGSQN